MIHYLITILLGPLLVMQGFWVKRNTPILPEAPGPRKGISGNGLPLSLLVLGDSAAAGVGAQNQKTALMGQLVHHLSGEYNFTWQLEAESGAKTITMINRIDQLTNCQFDVVLTSLGVNDVISNISIKKWLYQQQEIIDHSLVQFKAQYIIVTGLPPMDQFPALPQPLRWYFGRRAKQFNQSLIQLLKNHSKAHYLSLDIIDESTLMAEDGFHPSEDIYQQWANQSSIVIKSLVK